MLATKIAASTGVSSARYGRSAGLGNACPIVNRLPCYLPPCGGGRRRTAASGGGPASAVPLWPPPSPTLPHKGGGSERAERCPRDADGKTSCLPCSKQLKRKHKCCPHHGPFEH